jgi:hypothetical protein
MPLATPLGDADRYGRKPMLEQMSDLRALTIRQPWAWAIAYGGKDVENRSWRPPLWCRTIAVHAGARSGWDADGEISPLVRRTWNEATAGSLNRKTELMPFSAIIATAQVSGCHQDTECMSTLNGQLCSPWAELDQWHWALAEVQHLPDPVSCTGRLGLWRVPIEAIGEVRRQLNEDRRRPDPLKS